MEIKRTYSLVDISKKIDRPRTTLADWARQFEEFIPTVGSGRTMRYKEEAIEIFGIISKMKEANEPVEYIRDHLRGLVKEIIVVPEEDDGVPFLMNLSDEVDELKRAIVMLAERIDGMTTANDETRREVIAAATEKLSERLSNVSDELRDEIHKSQEQTREQISEIASRMETYGKRPSIWKRLFGR